MDIIYHNFIKFFIVGCIGFVIDISIYFLLLNEGYASFISKGLSFICSVIICYFLNSYFTFNRARMGSLKFFKYSAVYLFSFFVNMVSNEYMLMEINKTSLNEYSYMIAFIWATFLSLIINFLGLRYYVFRQ